MNNSRALSDTVEGMAEKDQVGFHSAVQRVTRSQNRLDGTNNKLE